MEKRFYVAVFIVFAIMAAGLYATNVRITELEQNLKTVEQNQVKTVRAVGEAVAVMERMAVKQHGH